MNKSCTSRHPQTGQACWQRGEHEEHPDGEHWAVEPNRDKSVATRPQVVRWK